MPQKVMDCPGYGSLNYGRGKFVQSRQRYECKECRCHHTVEKKPDVKSAATGRVAWELYIECKSYFYKPKG